MNKEYNLDQLYPQKQSQPEDRLVKNFRTHQHPHQDRAHFQPSARPLLHGLQQEDRSVATLVATSSWADTSTTETSNSHWPP